MFMISTAKKVDTFLAVLCLTAETLRVSPPTGPSLYPEALSRYSRGRYGGRSRGPHTSDQKNHSWLPLV